MKQRRPYRFSKRNTIALSVMVLVLAWCNAGFVVWNVARKISYEYVRSHRNELKFRDTIIVATGALKGSATLVWMKHDEIRYHGQMFDIKKQVPLGEEQTMLIGHYDKWENQLFKSLEHLLGTGSHQTPGKHKQVLLWRCEAVIPPQAAIHNKTVFDSRNNKYPPEKPSFYSAHHRPPPSPPPDACMA